MSAPGIWFVYRSHYEGPLSKRVHRIQSPSVLAFFQAQIEEARVALEPGAGATAAVGGKVYGYETLFAAAHKHSLHTPKTATALRQLLTEHLYVEGGEDHIHLDGHSLRVLTDDDEVALAYFFFDDEAVSRNPDRTAWLLHDEPRLPEGDADGAFSPPVEVPALGPVGAGEGATYVCLLTFHDSESLPGTVGVFPGVRLPGLAAHLRAVVPDARPRSDQASGRHKGTPDDALDTWPIELRLLRSMVDEGDTTLAPALTRAAAYPLTKIGAGHHTRLGTAAHATARAELLAAAEGHVLGGDPAKSIVHETAHAALLAAHASDAFGYQQWLFFDDRWAAAHPDLAASILHYGKHWDPFAATRPPKGAKTGGPKSTGKPKTPGAPKAPREAKVAGGKPPLSSKASAAATAAATRHDNAWKGAVAGRGEGDARAYAPAERFAEGELIHHSKFGLGVVIRVDGSKIEAVFAGTSRILVQGAK